MPIPVPDDFHHEPRWNPGLLNEQDQTAANDVDSRAAAVSGAQDPAVAWGSKPIRWASLKQPTQQLDAQVAESESRVDNFGLQLSAPKSRLRDVPGAEEIQPLGPAIDDAVQNAAQSAASNYVPRDLKMVPIESALAPASPASLELSPSYSDATPNQPPMPVVQPSTSSRYDTSGWRAK